MKAYKVFDENWKCRDFQYEVGKTYEIKQKPIACQLGFHACVKLSDCFNYYGFDPNNKVAEVEILGEFVESEDKICTNKIQIVKELKWEEVLVLCNSGSCNSGNRNSGSCNSGNRNSGNRNSGSLNSGSCNSGDCNSGDWNSGDCNSGDCNSGDWNSGDCNSGILNTDEPFVRMFNKNTKKKRNEINIPSWFYIELTSFVSFDTATEQERIAYKKEIETCGGFLKTIDYKEAWQKSYNAQSKEEQKKVKKLPNFDADIFFKITGIRVAKC